MKLAIISDIHGNRLALEAVLEDVARHGVDATVNLGDIVSGPMAPAETVELLMGLDMPAIRGNHDRLIVDGPRQDLGAVDGFAQRQLDGAQLAWLAALPATATLGDFFLCHGTPGSDEEPWLDNWWQGRASVAPDEAGVAAKAAGVDFPVMLCGHTHLPRAVRLRDGRLIVNPGSVGLQMNHGSPDARYALIERRGGKYYPSLCAVPYDHHEAARQAEANGFPLWREALVTGWVGAAGLF